ncbi:MAG TPA: amino acid racemase [Candidatus Dojkabacteria bacterium]|nr:amino acid racemase [Candidatus Dojkabacteria bacterium]HQF36990.1 amino acid racemase [Candidatus Dojkabacteria bacterium]
MNSPKAPNSPLVNPQIIVGIIGGMGPEATLNLFGKIIEKSKPYVRVDQDHIRIIIDNNPKIPDRTEFIMKKGKSPLPQIVKTAQTLEKARVTLGVISCMTSHYFFDDIQGSVTFPILNAYIETYNFILQNHPNVKKIGVLATTGTRSTKLFEKYITGKEIIFPSLFTQENKVMEAIYGEQGIKKGIISTQNAKLLVEASNELITEGAEIIIAGCTEIPLVLKQNMLKVPIIDPMDVVAEVIVEKAYFIRN